jgi:hypothetical protein
MAVSSNSEQQNAEPVWKRLFGQLTRYDLVLTVIPLVFVTAVLATTTLSVPFLPALAAGAAVSAVALVDALFVNPPVRR